jgi:hypothetical protein
VRAEEAKATHARKRGRIANGTLSALEGAYMQGLMTHDIRELSLFKVDKQSIH